MNTYIYGQHAVSSVLTHQKERAVTLVLQEGAKRPAIETLAKIARIDTQNWPKSKFKEKFGSDSVHQGVALEVHEFPFVDLKEALSRNPTLCVALDGIEDPRNLGRAARSAHAMGAELIILPKDRAATITATVEKAAVGALAQIPVARVTNLNRALDDAKKAGLWVIGTSDKASMSVWKCDLTKPVVLLVGNEEKGLRVQAQERSDELVQIPMKEPGFSLNAADAVTVLMYEVLRQRS